MLSKEEVYHIAKLARLGLTDEEADKFGGQINNILEYVNLLQEVSVEGVEPTSQVTGLENVTRKDEVKRFSNKEELLSCTPLPIAEGQIKVKSVIKNNA
jgi:aspartyl-tRNA(Asn)/glutamyl-tRNA(Gln) amidotransferase subunit C